MKTSRATHHLEELYRDGLESLGTNSFNKFEKIYKEVEDLKISRILNHLKIKILMSNGNFKEAIGLIKKTRSQFGDHISLTCDLAALYYSTYQYALWSQCLDNIEATLSSKTIQLSKDSYIKTMLLLAKFQEEQGAISKAYSSLLAVQNMANDTLELRVHANLLRLDVFYGFSNNISAYYYKVKQSLNSDLGYNTSPEIIHALIIGELALFGIVDLEKNLLKLIPINIITDDLLLIFIDVALLLCQKGIALPNWLTEKLSCFSSENMFEQKIIEYISNKEEFCDSWIQWPSHMPLGNFFHLSVLLNKKITIEQNKTLLKQITILTKHLPPTDQKYWRSFQNIQAPERLTITYNDENRSIHVEDINFSLKNKKILYQVLVLAARDKKVNLTKVVKDIFNSDFNESYYHRIRRLVKRINDEFEGNLLPPPLLCDKNQLLLCKKYQ